MGRRGRGAHLRAGCTKCRPARHYGGVTRLVPPMRTMKRRQQAPEAEPAPPPRRRRRPQAPPQSPGSQLARLDPQLHELSHGDGYRGDHGVQWRMPDLFDKDGGVQLAVQCKCERWWGWVPERVGVNLRKTMQRDGCGRCT